MRANLRFFALLVWGVVGLAATAQQLDTIVYISDTLGGLDSPAHSLCEYSERCGPFDDGSRCFTDDC